MPDIAEWTAWDAPRCHKCRFWLRDPKYSPDAGSCRRYPPTNMATHPQQAMAVFPVTFATAWCGEGRWATDEEREPAVTQETDR